jgi:hypothetical protein
VATLPRRARPASDFHIKPLADAHYAEKEPSSTGGPAVRWLPRHVSEGKAVSLPKAGLRGIGTLGQAKPVALILPQRRHNCQRSRPLVR